MTKEDVEDVLNEYKLNQNAEVHIKMNNGEIDEPILNGNPIDLMALIAGAVQIILVSAHKATGKEMGDQIKKHFKDWAQEICDGFDNIIKLLEEDK